MARLAPVIALAVLGSGAALNLTRNPKPKDYCLCQKFSREYYYNKVQCGIGKEFYPTLPGSIKIYSTDNEYMQHVLCSSFFSLLGDPDCVNLNVGRDEGSWCYVDVRCNTLRGGTRMPGYPSWKTCVNGRGGDSLLRDYSPGSLAKKSKTWMTWMAAMVRFAYPGARADQDGVVSLDDFNGTLSAQIQSKIALLQNGQDIPVWFDTRPDGKVPIVVVHRDKVWRVDHNPEAQGPMPGTWSELYCLKNCQGLDLE